MMAAVKILFVDDEPAIRTSLPAILRLHGFDVVATASVSEAIQEMSKQSFNVLISDLNIGSPGDGFTVVSAMRRTQPDCATLILTGYPAFETALQAIRSQVDDYLIKPAGVDKLVAAIEERLRNRRPNHLTKPRRICDILRESTDQIADNILRSERRILQLPRVHLSEEECHDNARQFIQLIADQVESGKPQLLPALVELSARHGHARYEQGYSAPMLVEENRLFCRCILQCVQENLLSVDVSALVPNLAALADVLSAMLREAISSYSTQSNAA
jgi:YesN/AraC family two-component response regulator